MPAPPPPDHAYYAAVADRKNTKRAALSVTIEPR